MREEGSREYEDRELTLKPILVIVWKPNSRNFFLNKVPNKPRHQMKLPVLGLGYI